MIDALRNDWTKKEGILKIDGFIFFTLIRIELFCNKVCNNFLCCVKCLYSFSGAKLFCTFNWRGFCLIVDVTVLSLDPFFASVLQKYIKSFSLLYRWLWLEAHSNCIAIDWSPSTSYNNHLIWTSCDTMAAATVVSLKPNEGWFTPSWETFFLTKIKGCLLYTMICR